MNIDVPLINEEYKEKINIIKQQTNMLDENEIINKINKYDGNHISVIKEYLGINFQENNTIINKEKIQQEKYKQMRLRFNP